MKPILIGGCGRSGTTLLGSMLGTHQTCIATPESRWIVPQLRLLKNRNAPDLSQALFRIRGDWRFATWGLNSSTVDPRRYMTFRELILALVEAYASKAGRSSATLWVDHTPGNARHAATLINLFPDSRFIHIIRDGRACAASVLPLDWGPNNAFAAANWWVEQVSNGLAAEALFGPERSIRTRFENLVTDPMRTLSEICSFLDIPLDPEMITGSGFEVVPYTSNQHGLIGTLPDLSRVESWRQTLQRQQVAEFESMAAPLLAALGYETTFESTPLPPKWLRRAFLRGSDEYHRRIVNRLRHRRRIRDSSNEIVT